MTAEELIDKAAACRDCGKEHEYRQVEGSLWSWAATDGHAYRPVMDTCDIAKLRYLATGRYEDPWTRGKSAVSVLSRLRGGG